MVADHPITMVLLILICIFGITNTSKGVSFTLETNTFVELSGPFKVSQKMAFFRFEMDFVGFSKSGWVRT